MVQCINIIAGMTAIANPATQPMAIVVMTVNSTFSQSLMLKNKNMPAGHKIIPNNNRPTMNARPLDGGARLLWSELFFFAILLPDSDLHWL